MQPSSSKRLFIALLTATLLTLTASIAFGAFFQLSKRSVFADVNPFADDPVDAIGSFVMQLAPFVAVFTLARVARVAQTPTRDRCRLILRGNYLALAAISITLLADTWMELQQPSWNISIWGQLLVIGLIVIAALTAIASVATLSARHTARSVRLPIGSSDHGEALAEALDDLWLLASVVLHWIDRLIPLLHKPLNWIEKIGTGVVRKVTDAPLIGARQHPWRFCLLISLAAGIALSTMHAVGEGPAANLTTTLFVAGFFIAAEFTSVFAAYVILGGFLEIRPELHWHHHERTTT